MIFFYCKIPLRTWFVLVLQSTTIVHYQIPLHITKHYSSAVAKSTTPHKVLQLPTTWSDQKTSSPCIWHQVPVEAAPHPFFRGCKCISGCMRFCLSFLKMWQFDFKDFIWCSWWWLKGRVPKHCKGHMDVCFVDVANCKEGLDVRL